MSISKEEYLKSLSDCVFEMEDEKVVTVAEDYLREGHSALDGINLGLVDGMNRAGVLYEQEEYFVTDLLLCSDAMYNGLDVLKPHLKDEAAEGEEPIPAVIGVVQGDTHDIGKNLVKIMFETAGFTMYDLGRDVPIEAIERLKRTGKEGVPIIGNLTGPLSLATSLADPIDFYKSLRRKNEDAHALMRRVTDMLTAFGTAQAAAGADVLAISDPSGTGEILGARYFREFAVRYLNELIRGVRHTFPDMRFIVHICGQMKNVFSELGAVEADAFSFDAMVNLRTAREHLAPRKVMGNVSSFGLAFASEEKVQAMARTALNMGSDILAPACGLGTRSDIRSVQALLRAARRNREEEDALLCTI